MNCARINLFIGKPNTGKSNILEAMSLFSLPFLNEDSSKRIIRMIRCGNLLELFHFGNTKDPILAVIGASTCVVKYNEDETISVVSNNEVKEHKYQVNKNLRLRFDRNEFEFPVVKRYIFPDKTLLSKRRLNYPIPPDGIQFKNEPITSSETEQRLNFFRTVINSNKNSILLFEEPDAHCFLPFTSQITQDMISNRENQYFLSTYSSFMIHDLLENAGHELAIFEVYRIDFETVIHRLSEDELNELFQKGVDIFTSEEENL